jgi:hypothetical protein
VGQTLTRLWPKIGWRLPERDWGGQASDRGGSARQHNAWTSWSSWNSTLPKFDRDCPQTGHCRCPSRGGPCGMIDRCAASRIRRASSRVLIASSRVCSARQRTWTGRPAYWDAVPGRMGFEHRVQTGSGGSGSGSERSRRRGAMTYGRAPGGRCQSVGLHREPDPRDQGMPGVS